MFDMDTLQLRPPALRPPGAAVKLAFTPDSHHLLVAGRGLHSSTFQLNLSRFRHKIHPEHPLLTPATPSTPPEQPLNAPPIQQKALTLSR
jgi:hypothetical protein